MFIFLSFKYLTFSLHGDCGKWEGFALKPQVNYTSWMTVVAPADLSKSVRYGCVIERFTQRLCVISRMHFLSLRSVCHTAASDLSLGITPNLQ